MPAEKYAWRPAEGVRSVGEVFTHITIANYGIARVFGVAFPAGIDPKALTAMWSDKPKVLQAMKDSFEHFRGAIFAFNEADADKAQNIFNRHTTLRGSFMAITRHFGGAPRSIYRLRARRRRCAAMDRGIPEATAKARRPT